MRAAFNLSPEAKNNEPTEPIQQRAATPPPAQTSLLEQQLQTNPLPVIQYPAPTPPTEPVDPKSKGQQPMQVTPTTLAQGLVGAGFDEPRTNEQSPGSALSAPTAAASIAISGNSGFAPNVSGIRSHGQGNGSQGSGTPSSLPAATQPTDPTLLAILKQMQIQSEQTNRLVQRLLERDEQDDEILSSLIGCSERK